MVLRDVNFAPVLNASGAQGFFGEGYPYHDYFKKWFRGFGFDNVTFVAKTTTLYPREGNMPLKDDGITPVEFLPKCIAVNHLLGVCLNAVGLSGQGAKWLLEQDCWQQRKKPFFVSFMAPDGDSAKKLEDTKVFSSLLADHRCSINGGKFGLEINKSCPNVKASYDDLVKETQRELLAAGSIGIPLVVKINALVPPADAIRIAESDFCDAICVSNTIPFGEMADRIKWWYYFPFGSPLARRGLPPGGLSGKPLFPIVRDWVKEARDLGFDKPIIAGGGILSPKRATAMLNAGANAISLGTIAVLRPHRMAKTIQAAYDYFDWDQE